MGEGLSYSVVLDRSQTEKGIYRLVAELIRKDKFLSFTAARSEVNGRGNMTIDRTDDPLEVRISEYGKYDGHVLHGKLHGPCSIYPLPYILQGFGKKGYNYIEVKYGRDVKGED